MSEILRWFFRWLELIIIIGLATIGGLVYVLLR